MKKQALVAFMLVLALALSGTVHAQAPGSMVVNYGSLTLAPGDTATNWPEVWDLTKGDITLSYTIDMKGITQPAPWQTSYSEIGIREVGAGNFNPGLFNVYQGDKGGWMTSLVGNLAPSPGTQSLHDKHNLSASGGRGEGDYDATDANTVVSPFGGTNNYGIWFDRDSVDQWQATYWGSVDGGTYNTNGVYNIVIKYHAVSSNLGTMFATLNGIRTGFYTAGWKNAQPDIYPAGLSFKGDMTKMQAFAGLWAPDPSYGNVYVSNLSVNGVPANLNATVTFHVHTGAAPGTGQAGYRVHAYNPGGGEIAWQDTNGSGDAAFTLNNGNYEYAVEKNGSYSARQSFFVAGANKTINHRLSVVTINAKDSGGTGYDGYRVHVYRSGGGGGGEWAWQDSTGGGVTTFYMVDGSYSYRVEKNGSYGTPQDFSLTYNAGGYDSPQTYRLSTVTINVKDSGDTGYDGYRVHVYRSGGGNGGEWAWQDSASGGVTTFYMVDGSYSYRVEKNGSYGAPQDFSLTYDATNYDLATTYRLSKVTINVKDSGDTGYDGYRVHVYRSGGGNGGEWAWQDSASGGVTIFLMVDGATTYSYRVEKNGSYGAPLDFTLTYNATNYDLATTYRLSTVTINVKDNSGTGHGGYRVHVYRSGGGGGGEWAWQDSSGGGVTTFYMVDGSYSYRVEYNGSYSAPQDFSLIYNATNYDLTKTYLLSTVTIKVTSKAGQALKGYRVHIYRSGGGGGGEWAWQDSNAQGLTTFYMVDGSYSYKVEKGCYWSAATDFAVVYSSDLSLTHKATVVITIKVGDHYGGFHDSYLVRVFTAGGGELANAWSAGGGLATFELDALGNYEYRVEKSGAVGPKKAFQGCVSQTIEYKLSKVVIKVSDHFGGGHAGYLVRVFNAGTGEWGNAWSDVSGLTTFWLIEGNYEYRVENSGAVGSKLPFTVVYSHDYDGEPGKDPLLEYKLSKVVVKVGDHFGGGHAGYLVRMFNAGAGEWGNAWSDASGLTTFWLIEGNYEYRIERSGAVGPKIAFTVIYSHDYDSEPGKDPLLEYKLSKVVIKVTNKAGQSLSGFLVRVFNAGAGEWGNAWGDASGLTTFWLIEGGYEYRLEKGCYISDKIPFTVVYSNDYTLVKKATTNVTIKVGDNLSVGHSGYLVRLYKTGGSELANQWSNGSGLTSFELDALGSYQYLVEKNGAKSAKKSVTTQLCAATSLEYKLAKVEVKASDTDNVGHSGYLVRIYNDGAGEWGNAWTNSGGLATFYLIEGNYEYLIEKNGAKSAHYDFSVAAPAPNADNKSLEYDLAKITVKASDTANVGHSGYLVRIYNDGLSEWGNAWTNGGGLATFYLIEGNYEYLIEKNGAKSAKYDFTVDPPTSADDQDLEYKLATVTVKASDTADVGHSGYLVRIYNDGAGEWGNGWTNGGGLATFYLIGGNYEYLIEKNGAKSAHYDFSVAAPSPADDKNLEYELAKVIIHVQNVGGNPLSGYLARIYNYPAITEWGNAWTNGSGDAVFYLIEGGYQYQVEKNGDNSGKLPGGGFTVLAPPPVDDQTKTHIILP